MHIGKCNIQLVAIDILLMRYPSEKRTNNLGHHIPGQSFFRFAKSYSLPSRGAGCKRPIVHSVRDSHRETHLRKSGGHHGIQHINKPRPFNLGFRYTISTQLMPDRGCSWKTRCLIGNLGKFRVVNTRFEPDFDDINRSSLA